MVCVCVCVGVCVHVCVCARVYADRKVRFITAYVSSKAEGYNWNTNITNVTAFSFKTNIPPPLLYKITKMYKSSFTENQGHILAICTATI